MQEVYDSFDVSPSIFKETEYIMQFLSNLWNSKFVSFVDLQGLEPRTKRL